MTREYLSRSTVTQAKFTTSGSPVGITICILYFKGELAPLVTSHIMSVKTLEHPSLKSCISFLNFELSSTNGIKFNQVLANYTVRIHMHSKNKTPYGKSEPFHQKIITQVAMRYRFTRQTFHLLKAPYQSDCFDYSKVQYESQGHCFEQCVLKYSSYANGHTTQNSRINHCLRICRRVDCTHMTFLNIEPRRLDLKESEIYFAEASAALSFDMSPSITLEMFVLYIISAAGTCGNVF